MTWLFLWDYDSSDLYRIRLKLRSFKRILFPNALYKMQYLLNLYLKSVIIKLVILTLLQIYSTVLLYDTCNVSSYVKMKYNLDFEITHNCARSNKPKEKYIRAFSVDWIYRSP